MTVGLPSCLGTLRRSAKGACWPSSGRGDVWTFGGVSQDFSSCVVVILDQIVAFV